MISVSAFFFFHVFPQDGCIRYLLKQTAKSKAFLDILTAE